MASSDWSNPDWDWSGESASGSVQEIPLPPAFCCARCLDVACGNGTAGGNSSSRNTTEIDYAWQQPPFSSLDPVRWELQVLYGDKKALMAFRLVGLVGLILALVSLLQTAARHLPQWRGLAALLREDQEPAGPVFKGKVLEIKVRQLRTMLQAACYLVMPLTALHAVTAYDDFHGGGHLLSVAQVLLAAFALWPRLVTARSLDLVFLLMRSLVSVQPFLAGPQYLVASLLLCNFLTMLLVAVQRTGSMRLPVLAVSSLLHGTTTCFAISVHEGSLMGFAWLLLMQQAVLALLIPIAAPLLERWSQAWMYQVLEIEELQGLLSASKGLLRSCFDVVVELDARGNIVGAGPELGALLLRDSARQCMQGEQFSLLIEGEESQQAFCQRLAEPAAKDLGLAENMQVTMKDACGNSLRLELMWFSFTRMGTESRERHTMVGLREFSDAAGDRLPQPAPELQERVTVLCGSSPQPAVCVVDVAVSEDSSSLPEGQPVSAGPALETGAVLVVDKGGGLPVRHVSASFRTRVGAVPRGKQLGDFLRRPQDFERWLACGGVGRDGQARDYRATFKMPQGRVRAVCRLLKDDGPAESLRLLFYNIQLEGGGEGRPAPLENRGTSPRSSSRSFQGTVTMQL